MTAVAFKEYVKVAGVSDAGRAVARGVTLLCGVISKLWKSADLSIDLVVDADAADIPIERGFAVPVCLTPLRINAHAPPLAQSSNPTGNAAAPRLPVVAINSVATPIARGNLFNIAFIIILLLLLTEGRRNFGSVIDPVLSALHH